MKAVREIFCNFRDAGKLSDTQTISLWISILTWYTITIPSPPAICQFRSISYCHGLSHSPCSRVFRTSQHHPYQGGGGCSAPSLVIQCTSLVLWLFWLLIIILQTEKRMDKAPCNELKDNLDTGYIPAYSPLLAPWRWFDNKSLAENDSLNSVESIIWGRELTSWLWVLAHA